MENDTNDFKESPKKSTTYFWINGILKVGFFQSAAEEQEGTAAYAGFVAKRNASGDEDDVKAAKKRCCCFVFIALSFFVFQNDSVDDDNPSEQSM